MADQTTQTATPFADVDRHGRKDSLTREERIARLRKLTRLLDDAVRVPGTNFRVGIDGIVGLVPFVGDAATTLLSAYIVREANELGVPTRTLWRMLGNLVVDGVVGLVPIVGDAFDVMYKANRKNMRLIEKHLEKQRLAEDVVRRQ